MEQVAPKDEKKNLKLQKESDSLENNVSETRKSYRDQDTKVRKLGNIITNDLKLSYDTNTDENGVITYNLLNTFHTPDLIRDSGGITSYLNMNKERFDETMTRLRTYIEYNRELNKEVLKLDEAHSEWKKAEKTLNDFLIKHNLKPKPKPDDYVSVSIKKTHARNLGIGTLLVLGAGALYKYQDKLFKSDPKNHSLEELVKNPQLFDTMNPNYTKDQEFCLSAISKNIDVFKYMNNNLIKNEEFLLKAIRIQNDILSLMIENEEYNEILKKPSFIDKLKTIETKDKEFKKIVESLDLDNNSKKNQKKDSHKKRTPEKKTSKKNR